MTKRVLPPAGKAAAIAGYDVVIPNSPITFRAVVADYMLAKGQGARYSARVIPIRTVHGRESIQRSLSIEIIRALSAPGVIDQLSALVDTTNRAALLADYATPTIMEKAA